MDSVAFLCAVAEDLGQSGAGLAGVKVLAIAEAISDVQYAANEVLAQLEMAVECSVDSGDLDDTEAEEVNARVSNLRTALDRLALGEGSGKSPSLDQIRRILMVDRT